MMNPPLVNHCIARAPGLRLAGCESVLLQRTNPGGVTALNR
jgi:hypothetical protein